MNQILYPNVTSLPGSGRVSSDNVPKKDAPVAGEFDSVFEQTVEKAKAGEATGLKDLNHIKAPLKFSAHAAQRLKDRNIQLDQMTMSKMTDAIDRAAAKGVEDTLVLTDKAALIVNVPNRTVVTALDKGNMNGNIFTNIDGAVVL